MPPISEAKKQKIAEQILHYLFTISPQSAFTNKIAHEIARDEEFTKSLLQDLQSKSLIVEITKNPDGKPLLRRQRWRLADSVYKVYSSHQ